MENRPRILFQILISGMHSCVIYLSSPAVVILTREPVIPAVSRSDQTYPEFRNY